MTEDGPPEPKPVHIIIGPNGEVTALVDGQPVDADELLASIQAAAKGDPDA